MASAGALAVHALCTYALTRVSVRPVERRVVEPLALTIDVETAEKNRAIDDRNAVPASAGESHGAVAPVAGSHPTRSVEGRSPEPAAEAGNAAPRVNESANAGDWSMQTTRVDIGIDARGAQTMTGRNGTATTAVTGEAPRANGSATGGLTESLDENDVAMGLGRGGPIRSAVEDAVQASNVMGTAAFEVHIETSGVVSVGLRNASEDAASWSRLSEAIRASVIAKRASVRLPPGARGLSVVVEASAKDLLPDGRSPSRLGTRASGTMGSITETKERIDIKLPSATLAHEGKVCAAGLHVGLDGIGILGGCSPENAGQVPVRMVAARILREARL